MPEDLKALEERLIREHAARLADAPPKQAKYMDAAELADFEALHGLGPHRPFHGSPDGLPRLPPGHVRQNVWPKPPVVTEGSNAFDMSNDQLRAFEAQHGLRSSGWR
jgi:hypothetical protein